MMFLLTIIKDTTYFGLNTTQWIALFVLLIIVFVIWCMLRDDDDDNY